MCRADHLIVSAAQLVTVSGSAAPRRGRAASELSVIPDGAMGSLRGRIVWTGPSSRVSSELDLESGARVVDASRKVITPGFVDSHTHAIFCGTREAEFARRSQGETYQQIAASGGGIASTVRSTRAAGRDCLRASLARHLGNMLSYGTTTVEVKSGYGLDLDTEVMSLEVLAGHSADSPQTIVPTFLGPHAVPPEFAGRADDYIDFVIAKVLPEVASRKLAMYADIFCEDGAFDVVQSRRFLEAASALGLGLRVHADEFTDMGASVLASELSAASADHLLATSDISLARLARSGTMATLLPATAFFLGKPFPDARRFIGAGAALALATDFNPGSCYCESMPFVLSTAVCRCGFTVEQAIVSSTANGAAALGLAGRKGSLQPGFDADFVLWDIDDYRGIPYHLAMPDISSVFASAIRVRGPVGTGGSSGGVDG
jgi:imidazolonepropionase